MRLLIKTNVPLFVIVASIALTSFFSQTIAAPLFRAFAIYSTASDHVTSSNRVKTLLTQMATANNFAIDFTTDSTLINDTNLAKYQLFIELHYAPGLMTAKERASFEKFIGEGKGWVGIHGAGLIAPMFLGSGAGYWQWFDTFFGGVDYVTHPAYQQGTLIIEDRTHPATKNLPASFSMKDEWYEFSKSPRPNARVLGKADESTYTPVNRSNDHPLVWTNENTPGRMIYIGVGHDSSACGNANWVTLVHDAIMWAGTPPTAIDGFACRNTASGMVVRPDKKRILIELTNDFMASAILTDTRGRMKNVPLEIFRDRNQILSLDRRMLPPGIYIIEVRGQKGRYSQRISLGLN